MLEKAFFFEKVAVSGSDPLIRVIFAGLVLSGV